MISWMKLNFNSAVISAVLALIFDYSIYQAIIINFTINIYSIIVVYMARKGYKKDVT